MIIRLITTNMPEQFYDDYQKEIIEPILEKEKFIEQEMRESNQD